MVCRALFMRIMFDLDLSYKRWQALRPQTPLTMAAAPCATTGGRRIVAVRCITAASRFFLAYARAVFRGMALGNATADNRRMQQCGTFIMDERCRARQ